MPGHFVCREFCARGEQVGVGLSAHVPLQWRMGADLIGIFIFIVMCRIGPVGANALHLATWRNHAGIVESVLGVPHIDLDAQDEESGWTALHRALYFGHVRLAVALVAAGANVSVLDVYGRTPVDLLSRHLMRMYGRDRDKYESQGHVFSWGNGSNYTLGTGSLEVELAPTRVDALHMHDVVYVAAAKFHSAAVTTDGKVYTWGWGRGGRLGHPEAHIHSGSSAVIHPRCLVSLERYCVSRIAVAKHHTLLTTTEGELFSMGSNRYGQLGYSTVDTQPEPRKIAALRSMTIVRVAAANKHSVCVSSSGDVFTWGTNSCGQLGYGAFDSISSSTPRVVDALKGRPVVECAAAKRHTVVLTDDGDVLTWGHRGVSPRKVVLNGIRKAVSLDGTPLRFQKGYKDVSKPRIQQICAGAAHSSALTSAGVVLTWRSADPHCQVQEIKGPLAGIKVVSISAGKYRTAAVTDIGTVYMWEGRADFFPAEGRVAGSGSKKWSKPKSYGDYILGSSAGSSSSHECIGTSPGSFHRHGSPSIVDRMQSFKSKLGASPSGRISSSPSTNFCATRSVETAFDPIIPYRVEGLRKVTDVAVGEKHSLALQHWLRARDTSISENSEDSVSRCGPGSLQIICQETIAKHMVDPFTVLQVMQYAEAALADMLYKRCCCVAALNLDLVMTEHPQIFAELAMHIAEDVEHELKCILNTPIQADKSDDVILLTPILNGILPTRAEVELGDSPLIQQEEDRSDLTQAGQEHVTSVHADATSSADVSNEEERKSRRLILKKLQQIHTLEDKISQGEELDPQQKAKVSQKSVFLSALAALDGGVPHEQVNALLRAASQAVVEAHKDIVTDVSARHALAVTNTIPKASSKPKRKSKKEKIAAKEPPQQVRESLLQSNDEYKKPALSRPPHAGPVVRATTPSGSQAEKTPIKQVGFNTAHVVSPSSLNKKRTTRKGGLSMFLRGGLEDPDSRSEKLAWGGNTPQTGQSSPLSKILSKEAAEQPTGSKHTKTPKSSSSKPKRQLGIKVSLKDYLEGKTNGTSMEGEDTVTESPTPWAKGTSLPESCPVKSLKKIQLEQEQLRAAQHRVPQSPRLYSKIAAADSFGTSPGARSSFFGQSPSAVGFLYGSSPGRGKAFIASPQPMESKWYIPEEAAMAAAKTKTLKEIQEEESALKEMAEIEAALHRFSCKDASETATDNKQTTHDSKRSKRKKKQKNTKDRHHHTNNNKRGNSQQQNHS